VERQELSLGAELVEREVGDRKAFELSLLVPEEAVVGDRFDPVRNLPDFPPLLVRAELVQEL